LGDLKRASHVAQDAFNTVVEGATNHAIIDLNAKDKLWVLLIDVDATINVKDDEVVGLQKMIKLAVLNAGALFQVV